MPCDEVVLIEKRAGNIVVGNKIARFCDVDQYTCVLVSRIKLLTTDSGRCTKNYDFGV